MSMPGRAIGWPPPPTQLRHWRWVVVGVSCASDGLDIGESTVGKPLRTPPGDGWEPFAHGGYNNGTMFWRRREMKITGKPVDEKGEEI